MRLLTFMSYIKRFNGLLTVSIILNSPLDRLLIGFASDDDTYTFPNTESTACSLYLLILELEVIFIKVHTDADKSNDTKEKRNDK